MKPINFKESTIELKKPESMTDDECSSLFIHQSDTGECISCWTVPFWKRLQFLLHGKIWLGVVSGKTQPPVWLDCTKTVFKPKVDQRLFWLGIINQWFIQWFFIRIFSNREEGKHTHYGILYWVYPFTGWITDYKILGEKIKYKHFRKKEIPKNSKKQECYKGHGLCDCTGLCRENC
jgi:hypothetical protein